MLWNIISTVLGLGGNLLEKRQKLKEIELESRTRIEVARAEAEIARLNKLQDAEIDWDREATRQMSTSWKDEYLTLLLSAPMILAFLGEWGRTAGRNWGYVLRCDPSGLGVGSYAVVHHDADRPPDLQVRQ